MERTEIITTLGRLGELFSLLADKSSWPGFSSGMTEEEYEHLQLMISKEHQFNPWYTEKSILSALEALSGMLKEDTLTNWSNAYSFSGHPKRVLIIMAGNLPFVGFHDLLCVLLSGNIAVCKLSSSDLRLLPVFTSVIKQWNPELAERTVMAPGVVKDIDAVIATGSDNSVSQFNTYFGKYPHIFRRNRTSIAVLEGNESDGELRALGKDMFLYFGLGCRNVSKIFIPQDFGINRIFEAIVDHGDIVNHHKYANNYDYNRTIYLMNRVSFLDNNFCLFKEDEGLFSPLSVFFIERYDQQGQVDSFLERHSEDIQTIVGHNYTPFGKAQEPEIDDYADGIDTMKWLNQLA